MFAVVTVCDESFDQDSLGESCSQDCVFTCSSECEISCLVRGALKQLLEYEGH